MQRVLVTGSTGFIGRHLVQVLARQGFHVQALVRSSTQAELARSLGASPILGDLDDEAALRAAASGVDTIFHLAGLTRARNEEAFRRVNAFGVERLARSAESGVHFVLVSSLAAAGPGTPAAPRGEGAVTEPVSAYGRSKRAGEELLWEAVQGGQPATATVLRPPMVYGPHDRDVTSLIRAVAKGTALLPAGQERWFSYAYGPDLAEAIAMAGGDLRTRGLTLNVASREPVSHGGLITAMAAAVDRQPRRLKIPNILTLTAAVGGTCAGFILRRPPILTLDKWREVVAPGWVADARRFHELFPESFPTSLEAGMAMTVAWARREGLLPGAKRW